VEALVEPYTTTHDAYQSYYRNSIAAFCRREHIRFAEIGSRFLTQLRFLRRLRDSPRLRPFIFGRLGITAADALADLLGADRAKPDSAVGCYVFHRPDGTVKVCIDAHDSASVTRPDLLYWSDLYFKTNFWPCHPYPAKVAPIANLNPVVFHHRDRLMDLRNIAKECDLFVFFRVWGGADEQEGVEHNLILLETLARVPCRKRLLAYLISGDIRVAASRLDKAGIPWTTTWMPRDELWRLGASSRLNIVRHGMHRCIPWRMTDALAMGACPVLDYAATTRWHVPLREGVHYLNLQVPYRPNGGVGVDTDDIIGRVENWLASEELLQRINRNTAQYFDEVLAPEALGRHIALMVAAVAVGEPTARMMLESGSEQNGLSST
jgi:hypothetical protein